MKQRGQGSLEYLIIIAAVLAIAAIVVLFLTGAFSGARSTGDAAACKNIASNCATQTATSAGFECATMCNVDVCTGDGVQVSTGCTYATAAEACEDGRPDCIVSA